MKYAIGLLAAGLVFFASGQARADEPKPQPKPEPKPVVVTPGKCDPCCGDRVLFQFKGLRRHHCGTICCQPCPSTCGPRCGLGLSLPDLFPDRPRCQAHPPCCEPCPRPCAPPSCGPKFNLGNLFRRCDPCCGPIYAAPAEPIKKMPEPKPASKSIETLIPVGN